MKNRKCLTFFAFAFIVLAGCNSQTVNQKAIREHSKAVHVMDDWMRDPYITLSPNGYYYLTVTQHGDTISGRPVISRGAPVYKSNDLAEWKFAGYYYDIAKDASNYDDYISHWAERKKQRNNNDPLKLWAPEIHFINHRWIIVHTSNSGLGNLAYTQGEELVRPYKEWGDKFGRQHDPSIFQDDDGSIWLVSRCAQIQKLKDDLSGFDGDPVHIGPSNRKLGHEGCYIIKFKGKYVLFGTGWSTDQMRHGTYNLYYCTADKITGPYGERKFAGRFLGHGTPFQDKNGNWWCTAFYNANEPALNTEEANTMDLSDTAYTINKQGLTLVPIEIKMVNGDVTVMAKDEAYRYPGREEVQKF